MSEIQSDQGSLCGKLWLTEQRLRETPDDQLLFFWTEVATFSGSGPLAQFNNTWKGSEHWNYEIKNSDGERVGLTDLCVPSDVDDIFQANTCTVPEEIMNDT